MRYFPFLTFPSRSIMWFIVLPLFLITIVQWSIGQDFGTLRGVVLIRPGIPGAEAIVELYSRKDGQCVYSGNTNAEGALRIDKLMAGMYTLEIKVLGIHAFTFGDIVIIANTETNLGYIKLWSDVSCGQPGISCSHDNMLRSVKLSCADDIKVLRDSRNSKIVIENDELRRRATHLASPRWPKNAMAGYEGSIEILIGVDGHVLCADTYENKNPISKAIYDAALQFQFQPVLEKGEPIAAFGSLEFSVP